MNNNLHNIYHEQDQREAKDNDSNFSADSFKRKRRKSSKVKKQSRTRKNTPPDTYDDASELILDESSIMAGDLSKVPSSKRFDEMKSLTMNHSKKSLGSINPGLSPMPSQISFTKPVNKKIMNNPVLTAKLSEGIIIRGE